MAGPGWPQSYSKRADLITRSFDGKLQSISWELATADYLSYGIYLYYPAAINQYKHMTCRWQMVIHRKLVELSLCIGPK